MSFTKRELAQCVDDLCSAVDGVDWDAGRVQSCVDELHRLGKAAGPEERDDAVARIAQRVSRSRVGDADGVAHAAISGGSLIEWGARPRPLGEALLARLPDVLDAARRFADVCLEDRADRDDPWEGIERADVVAEVDGAPIVRAVLRQHLAGDRAGGASLARLREWALPAVAAWTRDREVLTRAVADAALVRSAARMRRSAAGWLEPLLATQLDAEWRVALPESERVFDVRVDGVSRNFDLHTLVEVALFGHGQAIATDPRNPDGSVSAGLELFSHGAMPWLKSGSPGAIPTEHMVSREGVPTDVATFRGVRTLVCTRPVIQRSWRASRPFKALVPTVHIERELSRAEARELLSAMTAGEA